MKTAKSFLYMQLILLFLFHSASAQVITVTLNDKLANGKIVTRNYDKILLGDIDNDKIPDTAYVNKPYYKDYNDLDCKDEGCEVFIMIAIGGKPTTINFSNAVDAGIESIGDIDGDGFAEVIACPGWIIGCWGQYRIYSFKDGKWKETGRVNHNICEEEPYRNCIKSVNGNRIAAVEQVWEDGDVVEKTKIIEVK